MCLLVKEVEDLQERIGRFPVRHQTQHDSSNVSTVGVASHNIASNASVAFFCPLDSPLKSPFLINFFQTETNLSKEMEFVTKDIKNTTKKKYRDYGKNPGSPDNDFLFMYSVAR